MAKQKDWDYIAKLEKAIAEKYGDEAIANPNSNWDKEKREGIPRLSRRLIVGVTRKMN